MKCDIIAAGVDRRDQGVGLKVPLVVRLEGTNVELGRKILDESGPRDSGRRRHGRRRAEDRRRRRSEGEREP